MCERILVTGANGFIGRNLCGVLKDGGFYVRAGIRGSHSTGNCRRRVNERRRIDAFIAADDIVEVGNVDVNTNWAKALNGIDVVVHLAARAHVLQETETDPLNAFRRVNTEGTKKLGISAAAGSVRRLIYLSTIGVHGDVTEQKRITEEAQLLPCNAYALSKLEAELALREIEKDSDMEFVIVRPPLVYGPHVGGNFERLLNWVARRLPLPLGALKNRRSLVSVDNLSSLLIRCIVDPAAAGERFVVSDGEDVSTAELIKRIARTMRRPARLVAVPISLARIIASLVGGKEAARRLFDSLQVDASKAKRTLNWEPKISLDEGLKRTVDWYRKAHASMR